MGLCSALGAGGCLWHIISPDVDLHHARPYGENYLALAGEPEGCCPVPFPICHYGGFRGAGCQKADRNSRQAKSHFFLPYSRDNNDCDPAGL